MNDFAIVIEDGVEIPKREVVGRPRESVYPLEQMKAGQGFYLPVYGEEGQHVNKKDGTQEALTLEQDWQRKVRQKQSYFSQLAKKLNIKIVTRVFEDGKEFGTSGKFEGIPGIGVWHGGERDAEDEAEAAQTEQNDTDLPDVEV